MFIHVIVTCYLNLTLVLFKRDSHKHHCWSRVTLQILFDACLNRFVQDIWYWTFLFFCQFNFLYLKYSILSNVHMPARYTIMTQLCCHVTSYQISKVDFCFRSHFSLNWVIGCMKTEGIVLLDGKSWHCIYCLYLGPIFVQFLFQRGSILVPYWFHRVKHDRVMKKQLHSNCTTI